MCIGSVEQQIALLASYFDWLDSTSCKRHHPTDELRHRPSSQFSEQTLARCPHYLGASDIQRELAATGLPTEEEQALELTHTEHKICTLQALLSSSEHHHGWAQEAALHLQAVQKRPEPHTWPHTFCLPLSSSWWSENDSPLPAEFNSRKTQDIRSVVSILCLYSLG